MASLRLPFGDTPTYWHSPGGQLDGEDITCQPTEPITCFPTHLDQVAA